MIHIWLNTSFVYTDSPSLSRIILGARVVERLSFVTRTRIPARDQVVEDKGN